ncbi:MAG TPA: acyl-CoA dehydrogenase family protein [Acidimicrobiia bacterium]|nr:acyl-CoA dehydrogenase family protein [Acidimicrobiia bacterium]
MTVTDRNTTTCEGVLSAARELGPAIAGRAAEIEAARRVPPDLVGELVDAGFFRVLLPTSHHGVGADLTGGLRVIEALARADASVGWTVMIGGISWCDLASLPRPSFDALFASPGNLLLAGAFNPSGSIARVGHGYRVTGRWAFASGCQHAHWLYGNCIEGVMNGRPQMRMAVFPPDEAVIEDTWHVSGLRGTGSHHFHVTDVVVPADRTFVPLGDEPCLDEPVVHIPLPSLFAMGIAAVAVGTAQGALDDIADLAAGKVPLLASGALATNPLFQFELASADTELRAARALLYDTAEAAWAAAAAGAGFTLEDRARMRAAAAWITTRTAAVVDAAHRAGGGSSIYTDCPLQRRHRDIHAVTQHFLVKRDTLTTAGAILAGQDLSVPVF